MGGNINAFFDCILLFMPNLYVAYMNDVISSIQPVSCSFRKEEEENLLYCYYYFTSKRNRSLEEKNCIQNGIYFNNKLFKAAFSLLSFLDIFVSDALPLEFQFQFLSKNGYSSEAVIFV